MSEVDGGFGIADLVHRFEHRIGDHKRGGLREPDVFAGKDHHSSGYKFRIFAGLDHTGEIVERRIGLARAH